jgi:hypothetical protein
MKTPLEKYLLNQKEYEALSKCYDKLEEVIDMLNPTFGREIHLETDLTDNEDQDENLTVLTCIQKSQDAILDQMRSISAQNQQIAKKSNSKR